MSNKKNSNESSKSSSSSKILYTPYEKVLNILIDLKNYFSSKKIEKISEKFIKNINYIEKVITGHSLYEYEVKDKYKKDFVYQYNENILKMKNDENNQRSNIFKRSSAFYRQSTSLPALEEIIKKLNENNKNNINNNIDKSIHTESSATSDNNDKNNDNDNNNNKNVYDKKEIIYIKNVNHFKNKSVDFNIDKNTNEIYNNINNNNKIINNYNNKNIKSSEKISNNNNNFNHTNLNNINNIFSLNNKINTINNNNSKNKTNINNDINININITNNHNFKKITNKNNKNQMSLRSPNQRINLSPIKQRPTFLNYKITNLEIDFEKILGKPLLKKMKQRNKSFKNLFHSNNNNFITNYGYKNHLLKRNYNNNFLDNKKMYNTKTINFNNNLYNNNNNEKIKGKKIFIQSVNTSNLIQNKNNNYLNINNNTNNTNNNNNTNNTNNNNITLNYSINNSSPLRKLTKINYSKIYSNLKSHNFNILSVVTKEFNIFELERIIGYYNVLPIIGKEILKHFGLINTEFINIKKLDNFLNTLSTSYKKTTLYHNALHGSDVTQTICIFFLYSNIEKKINTNILDILSIVISALGHDLGHPGYNNLYLINSKNELAIRYNDISVLENFHSSFLWSILNNSENNIFDKLEKGDYSNLRKRMISLILATDMANHGKVVSKLKIMDLSKNENNLKFDEQQNVLNFIIHSADLAHNVKVFKISLHWVSLLSEEFWLQGDEEKKNNLSVSFLCDRNDSNVPKSQVGFIKGFVVPTFETLVNIFPSLNFTLENAKNNIKEWEKMVEKGIKKGWENDEYGNNNNK